MVRSFFSSVQLPWTSADSLQPRWILKANEPYVLKRATGDLTNWVPGDAVRQYEFSWDRPVHITATIPNILECFVSLWICDLSWTSHVQSSHSQLEQRVSCLRSWWPLKTEWAAPMRQTSKVQSKDKTFYIHTTVICTTCNALNDLDFCFSLTVNSDFNLELKTLSWTCSLGRHPFSGHLACFTS